MTSKQQSHDSTPDILAQALLWHDSGYSVLPVMYMDKRPHAHLIQQMTGSPGWGQFVKEQPRKDMLDVWFMVPAVNLGVIMTNDLCVLDFDSMDAWLKWSDCGVKYRDLPIAATARGMHVYFRCTRITGTRKVLAGGKVIGDLKANGFVVAPPSLHKTRQRYRWLSKYRQDDIPYVENLSSFLGDLELGTTAVASEIKLPPINDPSALFQDMTPITDLVQVVSRTPPFAHALCPLHADHNASFWIHEERNICGCWTCGFSGASVAALKAMLAAKEISQ